MMDGIQDEWGKKAMNKTSISRRQAIAGGAGVSLFLTSGCMEMVQKPAIENIDVQVSDVRTPSIGATSLTIPLILAFSNNGGSEVPDISMEADVSINNEDVATAQTGVGSLEGGERTQSRLNIIVEYAQAGGAILNAIRTGSFDLLLAGELHSDGPIFDASRRFRSRATS